MQEQFETACRISGIQIFIWMRKWCTRPPEETPKSLTNHPRTANALTMWSRGLPELPEACPGPQSDTEWRPNHSPFLSKRPSITSHRLPVTFRGPAAGRFQHAITIVFDYSKNKSRFDSIRCRADIERFDSIRRLMNSELNVSIRFDCRSIADCSRL